MPARFSHIRDHLRTHGIARDLLERSRRERDLVAALRARLPENLEPHCLDAGVADGKLTLFLDSPAWLTRARFQSEAILASLTSYKIDEIRFQVRLPDKHGSTDRSRVAPSRRLSETVVKHLLEAAEHQTDKGLSDALRNLARRHAQETPDSRD
ncbi:DciA family protein [Thiocystis violacea]|uniref:DciA family protein n=1 Tax=Thiocystis violacea TaxID=13725 RepID=UPI0019048957